MIKLKILKSHPDVVTPKYETENSVGMDLRAWLPNNEPIILTHGKSVLIPTGLKIEIPYGYEAQIRPRSGLALKRNIGVLNSPGTIDPDYRGDVGIILFNSGMQAQIIEHGDRIAQMVINKVEIVETEVVTELSDTARGEGGFGHTGTK
jgi:dUTP pyrophosphatase